MNIRIFLAFIFSAIVWNASAQNSTFNFTGGIQNYIVPHNVKFIFFKAVGAAGLSQTQHYAPGGAGGEVKGILAVDGGMNIQIRVGGMNGFNGGGMGAAGQWPGLSGGGATDFRLNNSETSRIIVAGGGGGAGGGGFDAGMGRGGVIYGKGLGGIGGSGAGLGQNGTAGRNNFSKTGGNGGRGGGIMQISSQGGKGNTVITSGGGGGGGFYGGEGGTGGDVNYLGGGGGGGGSSYTDPNIQTYLVKYDSNIALADGYAVIVPLPDLSMDASGLLFTRVRNPKNPDEDNAGFDVENSGIGYVSQEYDIQVTEVTNKNYADFLNAIAKMDTFYGLYNTFMGTDAAGGIVRSGASGNYSYNIKTGFESRPVNFVSIYDTLRYINWLHNGRPTTGLQDSSTTENGAYKLQGANPRNAVRNSGAKYFLPDQDEWHKAAFFDPNPGEGRPTDSYWPFADQKTTGPGGYFQPAFNSFPLLQDVGLTADPSHYGTYDQGGNAWEWTETVLTDGNRLISIGSRPMKSVAATQETADLGFRVARPLAAASASPLVVPSFVAVGEEFNLGDDTNGNLGAVVYEYQMGTYEVTNAEYAAFLNSAAKTDSFYNLYNTRMGTDVNGGIMRAGQNGNFSYTVKPGFAKKPVNFVNIYNAMRFCNWLHNGAQPNGDTEAGAYRLLGNIPSDTVKLRRNASARYFIPAEDEWYKAAFYDPSPIGMPTASYWSYATKSDSASAAMNFGGSYLGPMDIDALPYPSFFKTYGQSGNVAEWTETVVDQFRIVRGGHYSSSAQGVSSLGKLELDPLTTSANVGFRVAAAPGVASPLETVGPSPTPKPDPVQPPPGGGNSPSGGAPSGGSGPAQVQKSKKSGGKSSAKKSSSGSSKKSAASKSSGGKKSGGKKKKK